MRGLSVLFVASALQVNVHARSPVEKVVELIQELKAKINADADAEQKIYDKFACWCEEVTQRNANSIDDGHHLIGTTTTHILTLKGKVAVLTTQIQELEAKIAKSEAEEAKATGIREKANADYQQEKAEMETALSSLHAAIETLKGAGTAEVRDSDDMGLLAVGSKVRTAMLNSPHLAALSTEQSLLLKRFMQNPAEAEFRAQKAQAKASYSPASSTVMGILKDMYDTFASNLQKANTEESSLQLDFETVVDGMHTQNEADRKEATAKESEKAKRSKELSNAEQLLEDTQTQVADDKEIFEDSSDQCKAKAADWNERKRLRVEELTGIDEALRILTSDESRRSFAKSDDERPNQFAAVTSPTVEDSSPTYAPVFLQTGQKVASAPEKAYRTLKRAASSTKSLRLARIAATVRLASQGHFDEVISTIDGVLETLQAEEKEDITQRDWCIKERNAERNSRDNQAHKMEKMAAKMAAMDAEMERLDKFDSDLWDAHDAMYDDMQAAATTRANENQAFKTAKADDVVAIGLLEDAIAALSKYGDNNAFIQKREPVFDVSADQAPDATLSSGDAHAGATSGIITMLTQIKEDLEGEVKLGQEMEAKALVAFQNYEAAYAKQQKANELSRDHAWEESIVAEDHYDDADDEHVDATDLHDLAVNNLSNMKPNCDWIESAFTKRAEARKVESEGLQQAKAILAGSEGGEFGFLQRVQ